MNLADFTAFVFDAYGTIFDPAAPVMAARAKLKDPAGLAQLWRRKQLEYTWQRSLMGRHVDFWRVTAEALDYALMVHKIADPSLRALMLQQYLSLAAYPEAAGLLGALRAAGKRTAILSNGSPTMLTSAVSGAGLSRLLDAVLSVEAVGVFKPHPTVYQLAVDKLTRDKRCLLHRCASIRQKKQ